MTFYPSNNKSDFFNSDEFLSPDEFEYDNNNYDEINLDNYIKKNGDYMTGLLSVPSIKINNISSIAFTDYDKIKIDEHSTKLQNVIKTSTHTEISDLKCNAIQFANAIQNQAFTDGDKTTLLINQGKLDGITNSSNDIITTNKTINIKDSTEIDTVNTFGVNNKFDGALSFFRTGSVYRKFWIGSIGDTINPNNTFNICVNGNHTEPENILELNHNGELTIKSIKINNETQNKAFTNEIESQINNNKEDIDVLYTQTNGNTSQINTINSQLPQIQTNKNNIQHIQTSLNTFEFYEIPLTIDELYAFSHEFQNQSYYEPESTSGTNINIGEKLYQMGHTNYWYLDGSYRNHKNFEIKVQIELDHKRSRIIDFNSKLQVLDSSTGLIEHAYTNVNYYKGFQSHNGNLSVSEMVNTIDFTNIIRYSPDFYGNYRLYLNTRGKIKSSELYPRNITGLIQIRTL